MTAVVDPTDENVAILSDGTIGRAIRFAPAGTPFSEMSQAPIIGYGLLDLSGFKKEFPDDPLIA